MRSKRRSAPAQAAPQRAQLAARRARGRRARRRPGRSGPRRVPRRTRSASTPSSSSTSAPSSPGVALAGTVDPLVEQEVASSAGRRRRGGAGRASGSGSAAPRASRAITTSASPASAAASRRRSPQARERVVDEVAGAAHQVGHGSARRWPPPNAELVGACRRTARPLGAAEERPPWPRVEARRRGEYCAAEPPRARGRVERQPAVAAEPDLHPGVRVVVGHHPLARWPCRSCRS